MVDKNKTTMIFCFKNCSFKESAILGFRCYSNGIRIDISNGDFCEALAYSVEDLRQAIGDFEFNMCLVRGFGCGGDAAQNVKSRDFYANFPALVYVVRDGKGNIKFCDARHLSSAFVNMKNTCGSYVDAWVNQSPVVCNIFLGVCDANENVG